MSSDYFLKIDGIPGESPDAKHKDEIQLLSWSWGETNAGAFAAGSGGGAGKVNMQDFTFVSSMNKASPILFLSCATGKHIAKAELTCRKAGEDQREFLKVYFEELLVSSYQTGGGGEGLPTETISFNFTKIKFEYAAQKANGTLDKPIIQGYDLKAGKKI